MKELYVAGVCKTHEVKLVQILSKIGIRSKETQNPQKLAELDKYFVVLGVQTPIHWLFGNDKASFASNELLG